ncbi:6-bladed beta-propeller [Parapedobacter tibetensis]|uniref:6-bladed beta-propeller n=1 Tax=Parapedobacter tibetensis TaxID=2972951 RepID=UPI00214D5AE8|nr:6-bladed beta-propeller [Parapedobacter tibetensis]
MESLSDVPEVNIRPDKHVSLNTKDFIDSVQYIALETTHESEFGEISQIQIAGDFFVILDKFTNEILFFRKNGGFVRKISAQNDDIPIPFKSILKFTIDTENEILSFPDALSPYIYEFDLLGNFIKTRKKEPVDYTIRESHYLNTFKIDYFSYDNSMAKKPQGRSITVTENGRENASYLYFDPSVIDQDDVYGARKYFFQSTEQLLFSRPYDYTIYTFGDNGEMNAYLQISLPENLRIPSDFLTSNKYSSKRRAYTNDNKSRVYLITDVYKTGKILYFKLIGSKYIKTLLYDLNTDVLINFRNYLSDSSTLYLPIAGTDVLGVDNNRLISVIPSTRMIQALNTNISISGYLASLPDHLREYYKRGNNQNPVLVLTKLKKSINYETDS